MTKALLYLSNTYWDDVIRPYMTIFFILYKSQTIVKVEFVKYAKVQSV